MKNFALRQQMRALGQMPTEEPSAALEAKLLKAFREKVRQRRRHRMLLGLAASFVLTAGTVLLSHAWSARVGRPGAVGVVSPAGTYPSDFIPLPYAQSGIPLEGAIVVRVDVPASQIGFAVPEMGRRLGTQRKVHAELLVGQDGVPRAVRVLK